MVQFSCFSYCCSFLEISMGLLSQNKAGKMKTQNFITEKLVFIIIPAICIAAPFVTFVVHGDPSYL